MRVLVVLGEGGHTKEMVTLVDQLGDDLEYAYLMVDDDEVSPFKISRPGPTYRVRRPRDKQHHLVRDTLRTMYSTFQALRVLREWQPDAVLTSGPSVAVPVCLLARLRGRRVVFVENGSRVTRLSLTGRILYRVATLFLVQWPELAERRPRALYCGRLF